MKEPVIYVNGNLLPASRASVSVMDHGFLFGDGIFETVRAYHGRIFEADAHFTRLCSSAVAVEIELPFDRDGFLNILTDTLSANGLADASLRLSVTRGIGNTRPAGADGMVPTVVAFTRPVHRPDAADWAKGIHAVLSPVQARPPEVLDPAAKCHNFLPNVLALRAAKRAGAGEAILLNARGEAAEGTVSNLFGVWDGVLVTPSAASGILPGVTRNVVLELAGEAGLPVEVITLPAERLASADELFVTSTGWEIMPVTALDGKTIGSGQAGPVTTKLYRAFTALTGKPAREANA